MRKQTQERWSGESRITLPADERTWTSTTGLHLLPRTFALQLHLDTRSHWLESPSFWVLLPLWQFHQPSEWIELSEEVRASRRNVETWGLLELLTSCHLLCDLFFFSWTHSRAHVPAPSLKAISFPGWDKDDMEGESKIISNEILPFLLAFPFYSCWQSSFDQPASMF